MRLKLVAADEAENIEGGQEGRGEGAAGYVHELTGDPVISTQLKTPLRAFQQFAAPPSP